MFTVENYKQTAALFVHNFLQTTIIVTVVRNRLYVAYYNVPLSF